MFLVPLPLSGLFAHGPGEIRGVEMLRRAIASESDLSNKQAAAMQDLSEPQWSRQCSGAPGAHVSLQRIFRLPRKVLARFGRDLFEEFSDGGICVEAKDVERHQQLQQLIDFNQRLLTAVEARAITVPAEQERRRA